MTFRTNRLYYLLTPVFWKRNAVVLLGLLLLVAVNALRSESSIVFSAITALLFDLIYSAFVLCHLPKRFSVSDGEITLQMHLKRSLPAGIRFNRQNWRYVKYHVTVCRIRRIEYRATGRNAGRIYLYGEIRTQNRQQEYEDLDDFIERVELYGVKSLLSVQEQLKSAFPKAEHVNV